MIYADIGGINKGVILLRRGGVVFVESRGCDCFVPASMGDAIVIAPTVDR